MEGDKIMKCKEPICTKCTHKDVCQYTPSYCNVLEQIAGLDIRAPFKADLSCVYFKEDIAVRLDTRNGN